MIEAFKEVKYLKQFEKSLVIPPETAALYDNFDNLKNDGINIENLCNSYNKVILKTRLEEKKLIERKLNEIDKVLYKGEHEITWDTDGLSEYVQMIKANVKDLELRVRKSKVNIKRIKDLMSVRRREPLFKRGNSKSALLQINDKNNQLNERFEELREINRKIIMLIQENKELLLGKEKLKINEFDLWKKYVSYIDEIIEGYLYESIDCSFRYIHFNLNSNRKSLRSLMEAHLVLESSSLIFVLKFNDQTIGVKAFFIELLKDILNQADCVDLSSRSGKKETFKV